MSVLNEVNNLSASHVPAAVSYDDDARTTTHPTHVGDPLTKSTTTRNRSCSGWVIWPLPLLPFTTTKEGFIWVKAAKVAPLLPKPSKQRMFVNRCRIRFVPLPFFDPSNNVDASDAFDDAFDDASNAFMSVDLSDLSNATQHTVASWPSTCCACTAAHAMPLRIGAGNDTLFVPCALGAGEQQRTVKNSEKVGTRVQEY
jgi:hypothetical protein